MKKQFFVMSTLILLSMLVGCGGGGSSSTDTAGTGNVRILVSDEPNAIGDFEELLVTVSSIGVKAAGEAGSWITLDPQAPQLDLTLLNGQNAQVIWSGELEPGEYTKMFLYIDEVTGSLVSGENENLEIKLPSNKLQVSVPFTVTEGEELDFVFDITVIQTGNGMYILKPQIAETGPDQDFDEVEALGGPEEDYEELSLEIEGDVFPGALVTLTVIFEDLPVEGATVFLDDVEIGETNSDGELDIPLPEGVDEVEIKATTDDGKEGEMEISLEDEDDQIEYFEGIIVDMPGDGNIVEPWLVDVLGLGEVEVYIIEVKGSPFIGALIEIEGILADGSITEAIIEVIVEEEDGELSLEIEGDALPGALVTLTVIFEDLPVEGATVFLDDVEIGETNSDGELDIPLPEGVDEVEIKATTDDGKEGEIEIVF